MSDITPPGGSWDPFMPPPELQAGAIEQRKREEEERDAHAALVRATFATPAGRQLLAAWAKELQAPSYAPGDSFDQVAHREGRRDFIRQALRLAQGKEG